MGLGLDRKFVTLSASEGSAFSAVFRLAQPSASRFFVAPLPQNDPMTDRAGLEVGGFTLRDFASPRDVPMGLQLHRPGFVVVEESNFSESQRAAALARV
jgi:hypothetical protein